MNRSQIAFLCFMFAAFGFSSGLITYDIVESKKAEDTITLEAEDLTDHGGSVLYWDDIEPPWVECEEGLGMCQYNASVECPDGTVHRHIGGKDRCLKPMPMPEPEQIFEEPCESGVWEMMPGSVTLAIYPPVDYHECVEDE